MTIWDVFFTCSLSGLLFDLLLLITQFKLADPALGRYLNRDEVAWELIFFCVCAVIVRATYLKARKERPDYDFD